MKKAGEVSLIINDKFAVIKTIEPLILGSEIYAYTEISLNEEASSKSGIQKIQVPKGKLLVMLQQSENVYLVSVITKRSAQPTNDNQTLAKNLSLYNSIFGKKENEADNTGDSHAPYSAKLDPEKGINYEFNILVVPGDLVAFKLQ